VLAAQESSRAATVSAHSRPSYSSGYADVLEYSDPDAFTAEDAPYTHGQPDSFTPSAFDELHSPGDAFTHAPRAESPLHLREAAAGHAISENAVPRPEPEEMSPRSSTPRPLDWLRRIGGLRVTVSFKRPAPPLPVAPPPRKYPGRSPGRAPGRSED